MDMLAASANCRFSSSVGYLTSPIAHVSTTYSLARAMPYET
jgi:hypothetical protein